MEQKFNKNASSLCGKMSYFLNRTNKSGSLPLIIAAIVRDNSLDENITVHEMLGFCSIAADIEDLMQRMDEPRFTLYDYLDAVIHHPLHGMAENIETVSGLLRPDRKETTDEKEISKACKYIVSLAEDKRRTYSMP